MKVLIVAILVLLASSIVGYGQIIKNIIPMRSTCEDVKRILKVDACKQQLEFYNLPNERVEISYSIEDCPKAYLKYWDVPKGTVLSVIRNPRKLILLNELSLDIKECEKFNFNNDLQQIGYYCKETGTTYSFIDDYLSDVTYTPTAEDTRLLRRDKKCKSKK
jgi:hypothetical protein